MEDIYFDFVLLANFEQLIYFDYYLNGNMR